ncbi:MAG: exosortase system-associated protein, TIGR04073 family [Gammaproteobacteria bacterium]
MNNKNLFTASALAFALLAGGSAYADDKPDYLSKFTSKVNQGFFNTTTGWIEIPKNVVNISHDQNIFVGFTWGLLRGTAHAVSRTVVGVGELITSPIPTKDYISPPYVWDRFSEDTRYFGVHYPGFWTTYGPLDDGDDD